jgi:two-component system cell cycle sensor histidine kinase/response regulator CckA
MENMPKLFDPFYTTKEKGTGLGLSICYSIITRHNGFIDVESKTGAGTTFSTYLPASENIPQTEITAEPQPGFNGRGRILLMDDDEAVLSAASQMIRLMGFSLEVARNGAEAIDLYKKAKEDNHPFDVVIMDLTVPGGMSGKEAILRLLQFDPEVRAVVSSGYSTDKAIAEYKRYGFKAAIVKPYNIQNLKEVLGKVMAEKS